MASWIKLDTSFGAHPKVLAAGLDGAGLYVLALAYCGEYLTDGFVPASWVKTQRSGSRVAAKVTAAGLWRPVVAGELLEAELGLVAMGDGFYVPDYLEHQRSRADVLAARARMAAGGRKGMAKRWGEGGGS